MSRSGFGAGTGGPPDNDPFGGSPFGSDPFIIPSHPAGPPGAPPSHPAASPEVNTLATLSVIFAFVFAPAGAVLGHLGLAQIARTGQRGRRRALIGLVLSYVVIVVAVAAIVVWSVTGADPAPSTPAAPAPTTVAPSATPTTTSTVSTPPPAPVVEPAALPGLLLTDAEARALTGDTGLNTTDTLTAPELPPTDESVYEPLDCLPSFLASTTVGYSGSGHTGFHGTVPANYDSLLQIAQAVSSYSDAATAQGMLNAYRAQWARCAGTTLQWHMMQDRATAPIILAAPQDAGDGVVTLVNESGLDHIPYQRAIAVKNNVLIDVQVSGGDERPGTAAEVAKRIMAKIPG